MGDTTTTANPILKEHYAETGRGAVVDQVNTGSSGLIRVLLRKGHRPKKMKPYIYEDLEWKHG